MESSAIIAILTFLVVYGILATEKINRTIIVGAGSIFLLVLGILDLNEAINYVTGDDWPPARDVRHRYCVVRREVFWVPLICRR